MNAKPGYIEHTIKIARANSRFLHDPRIYLLLHPTAYTKYQHAEPFRYVDYFREMLINERFEDANTTSMYAASPYVFCMFMSKFISHLYVKYSAKTLVYNPRKNNYYHGGIVVFYFEDAKKRLLFELQYNSLREKYLQK